MNMEFIKQQKEKCTNTLCKRIDDGNMTPREAIKIAFTTGLIQAINSLLDPDQ